MHKQIIFHDKPVQVDVSEQAKAAAASLSNRLLVEIQVYFSCMLGKRLAFYTDQSVTGTCQIESQHLSDLINEAQPLTDKVFVRFNTVMTSSCSLDDYDGPPPVTDFHIKNQKPYVPDWLNLDYKNGVWCGEYGWASSDRSLSNTRQVRGFAQKRVK